MVLGPQFDKELAEERARAEAAIEALNAAQAAAAAQVAAAERARDEAAAHAQRKTDAAVVAVRREFEARAHEAREEDAARIVALELVVEELRGRLASEVAESGRVQAAEAEARGAMAVEELTQRCAYELREADARHRAALSKLGHDAAAQAREATERHKLELHRAEQAWRRKVDMATSRADTVQAAAVREREATQARMLALAKESGAQVRLRRRRVVAAPPLRLAHF